MEIEHYSTSENKRKESVVDFMWSYNSDFTEFDISIVEQCNKWLTHDGETLTGRDAIKKYYESLCDELLVIVDSDDVVACRFVEFDEENQFFRERVDDYEPGLNLTFALVDDEYRGEGLWTKMFRYVLNNILPTYPVDRVYLVTSSENIPMQKAVEAKGFDKIAVEKDGRAKGIHNVIYCYTT